MTVKERVAGEEVRRVADLAHLQLTPQEEQAMQRDLSSILDYVGQLNELDTANIPPMAQVAEVLQASAAQDALRADQPRPSLERDRVMKSAPDSDGVFFKVPKVIER
ncbi:Asp-tRNA(Asn)/Glu-tRNA(Gln) amidotransferase subunit GatC [Silvibacterium dinghuense]|uniref:Aspartyl/glutamyl-tRNA(Asn/Gln) amidotransferase subunit C n=1 Tax=Silvibacterium dinghuense TaxID=1560006 RepID=A0A4Q1SKI8_9BACT|nr:Asp-tRNA(Asn)/Glu-tRNA(Gln) amidotransferase subunit GatC [Silvibacterium dinghuense]RXS97985.1 Asp-tRNA(Asn)/Glu-tRNA(Gln) amidotransferase subunit GatC [Silvibacterium dinghuense]GGH03565.1 aspartyl/glutamyl-tRNA(Asn/Gln) amidotransferase subunit C [Silvibacterium dinghuense]